MRVAIVTGGSRGLGLALCEQLLRAGYRVLEFSRTAPHSYSVRLDLSSPHGAHETVSAAIAPLVEQRVEDLVVVSNAGMLTPIGPSSTKAPDAIIRNLSVNLTSPVLLLTSIVLAFQQTACRKVVVNVSSGAAVRVYPGWSLYCAANAGLEHYVRTLAEEQRHHSWPFVAINIDPGVIDTDMQADIRASSPVDFPEVQRFIRRKNEGVLVDPRDVAQRVLRIVALPELQSGARYNVTDVNLREGPA